LDVDVVTREQEFRALEPEWRALFGRLPRRHYFSSFDWAWRAWEHVARLRGQRLFIVVGRRTGQVVLIWPLARFRKTGLRSAEWLGGEQSYCHDVLVEAAPEATEWLEAAWSRATKSLDFLWLNHMCDDAVLAPLLRRVEGVDTLVEEAPYVDWSEWPDWEAYWSKRSKNLRRDLGRRRRRLEEQGEVAFGFVTAAPEVEKTLDWMAEHKAAWMKEKGLRTQDGAIDTPGMRAFYRGYVADARASDNLRLATLTLDGSVLAAEMGILFEGRFVDQVGAFDLAWEKYAPGKLLQADLLRWTLENGCAVFDFMPFGESFKYLWAPTDAERTTYLVPCSPAGRMLVAWRRSPVGAAARSLLRLRPRDVPRILRKQLSKRPPTKTRVPAGG
jgi:CelD/BcsL family acetyltransferase involved in cellulose biosynthesis